jgi:hypothetical protein
MSNLRDSGGFRPEDTQSGGTQTLEREPEAGFPVQKVLVGGVVGILVIAVVVLGVYVSRQGKEETTAVRTTTRSDVYDGIPVTIKDTGNVQENRRSMRVVSAKGDLTGQRELAWPADEGTKVGDARCTQNFQFNAQSAPGIRPTLMICWRTSKDKSVYTVAVDVANKPSAQNSVAVLDREWNSLT